MKKILVIFLGLLCLSSCGMRLDIKAFISREFAREAEGLVLVDYDPCSIVYEGGVLPSMCPVRDWLQEHSVLTMN